jgi:hypothetical protein
MIQTKHGVLTIENSTRYNTDDLVGLFNRYEDNLVAAGHTPRLDSSHTSTVDVVDYKPVCIYVDRNQWSVPNNRSVSVRDYQYVKPMSWAITSRNVMGLVPPERLYDNPVEALTKADSALAPPLMVEQILTRIAGFYLTESWEARRTTLDALREGLKLGLISLRIEDKRAPCNTTDIRQRKARISAFGAASSLSGELYKVREELAHVRANILGLNAYCAKAGVSFRGDVDALGSVFTLLEEYRAEVEALATDLRTAPG